MRRSSGNELNWLIGAMVAMFVLAMAFVIYNEIRHPCLEYQTYDTTCGGDTYCSMRDSSGNCMIWGTNPTYPCRQQRCVRRQP